MADNPKYNPAAVDGSDIRPLSDDEIKAFVDELDHNNDGFIDYSEVEAKLDATADELKPDRNLGDKAVEEARHAFLRSIIGADTKKMERQAFVERVKSWRIPSLQQEQDDDESQDTYMRRMGFGRRLRSYWAVHGPTIVFMIIVVGMMIAFGGWQLVKYLGPAYSGALGWGVVVAKTCAGMLYPTLFFLLLSMARYFSTLLRRSYTVSRFINWDLSQEFHIYMAITATLLGTLHGIAHLAGDFVWIGNAYRPQPLDELLGADRSLRTYRDLIKSRPGITGILALFLFYTIGLMSTPWVRKKSYELFQLSHLLMYVIIGCLMAHGTSAILQWPMLGYFLAFPTLLVLIERTTRVLLGFYAVPATVRVLDSETVEIKATVPQGRMFQYCAGQYLFLQVPALSFFQWHPFTISVCRGKDIQLHIKTDGNWTSRLRELATDDKPTPIRIGIDGPYGAPAQRFYDFSHTILVGSGIGITPFSGILVDLQAQDNATHGGPKEDALGCDSSSSAEGVDEPKRGSTNSSRRASSHGALNEKRNDWDDSGLGMKRSRSRSRSSFSRRASGGLGLALARSRSYSSPGSERQRNPAPAEFADDYRRVDLHWVVRSKNHLGWFSDLLNAVCWSQAWHRAHDGLKHPHLDIRIQTHVSQKRNDIATHVYRWLLEFHRTDEHPQSPLTGLINPTHFGRPDFVAILDAHYEDMLRYRRQHGFDQNGDGKNDRFKVGVFFCGAPMVGEIIADRCRALTARGRADGTRIEYYFMMEVFG